MGRKGADPPAPRFLPLLVVLFIGSGCAALIYEIVWLQLLQFVVGSSAISTAVLLGAFMGGMGLGSLLLPRYLDVRRHPLLIYAALEVGIGVLGLLLLFAMPVVTHVYAAAGGGIAGRAFVAGVCLLPPAVLMGATLPAIARWVETTPSGVSWLGFFYGGNLGGAVLGCLLAGFYLLPSYDMRMATYVAASLNFIVAAAGYALAARTSYRPSAPEARREPPRGQGRRAVYIAIALSGYSALASEVIWTRLLSLLFGATVYTFSLILASFLAGLGVGSSVGATLARTSSRPAVVLAGCQLLLCAAIVWAAYLLGASLPYWPVNPSLTPDPWIHTQFDLFRCALVVLPGAVLWGASVPLALAAAASPGEDAGRLAGGVYAANTIGAVTGALSIGVIVVAFDSQVAQQVAAAVPALGAVLLLVPAGVPSATGRMLRGAAVVVAVGVGLFALARVVPPVPGVLVAYGRYSATWVGLTKLLYVGEGMNASVAVSRAADGALTYHNAGKVQASTLPEDMRLQRMLGHLSHLIPARPASVLVIGLGAGVTAGALAIAADVERITIAEIEPLVPRFVAGYFADFNHQITANPKATLVIDDARHFLLTTDQTFDVITSDMVDPWVKGTAALFTREFFELARRRLNPGGIMTLFVQLYQSNLETVKSEVGTLIDVFPNTVVWGNTNNGQGYDLVLTAQVEPVRIDVDALQARLQSPAQARVAESLRDIGMSSAVDLLSTFAGSAADLTPWLRDAVINRDRHLRLQYLAGMGLHLAQSEPIYAGMLQYARFPSDVFVGSAATIQTLKDGIARTRR